MILNKEDRFFLEFQKQRVIQSDSAHSSRGSGDSSDEIATGRFIAPYGEQREDRKHFIKNLAKYLKKYEEGNHRLKESQRRILLGIKTANVNLLDKAIHERKLKKEKLRLEKAVQMARAPNLKAKRLMFQARNSHTIDMTRKLPGLQVSTCRMKPLATTNSLPRVMHGSIGSLN